MIILLSIMIELTMQNVVTILCPLVHRFTTVKGLQMLLFCTSQIRSCRLTCKIRRLTAQV